MRHKITILTFALAAVGLLAFAPTASAGGVHVSGAFTGPHGTVYFGSGHPGGYHAPYDGYYGDRSCAAPSYGYGPVYGPVYRPAYRNHYRYRPHYRPSYRHHRTYRSPYRGGYDRYRR